MLGATPTYPTIVAGLPSTIARGGTERPTTEPGRTTHAAAKSMPARIVELAPITTPVPTRVNLPPVDAVPSTKTAFGPTVTSSPSSVPSGTTAPLPITQPIPIRAWAPMTARGSTNFFVSPLAAGMSIVRCLVRDFVASRLFGLSFQNWAGLNCLAKRFVGGKDSPACAD